MEDKQRNALVGLSQRGAMPQWARSAIAATLADSAVSGLSVSVEQHVFDESYLEFLDTQIRLAPRGPRCAAMLRARRLALEPFVATTLIRVEVRNDNAGFVAHCRAQDGAVVHTENI